MNRPYGSPYGEVRQPCLHIIPWASLVRRLLPVHDLPEESHAGEEVPVEGRWQGVQFLPGPRADDATPEEVRRL